MEYFSYPLIVNFHVVLYDMPYALAFGPIPRWYSLVSLLFSILLNTDLVKYHSGQKGPMLVTLCYYYPSLHIDSSLQVIMYKFGGDDLDRGTEMQFIYVALEH